MCVLQAVLRKADCGLLHVGETGDSQDIRGEQQAQGKGQEGTVGRARGPGSWILALEEVMSL